MSDDGTRWMSEALCRDYPGHLWFPTEGSSTERAAKAICARCPVQRECLDHALDHEEHWGIWGGESQRSRRRMQRQRRLRRRTA